jgi:hypothetical protein
MECVREGVSSGCEGERRGDGGWFGAEEWLKGLRGEGRRIFGEEDMVVFVRRSKL